MTLTLHNPRRRPGYPQPATAQVRTGAAGGIFVGMSEQSDAQREAEWRAAWLSDVRRGQDGVTTRQQLIDGGWTPADIRRAVRRNELRRVHPRVYVNHTGPLTWRQRAWAAVLYAEPAALCWDSVEEPRGSRVSGPIHVAVERSRRIAQPKGVVLHRMQGLWQRRFGGSPPRLRLEDNALAMADAADDELGVIALLAAVLGKPFVTPLSLKAALDRFPTLRRRRWVSAVIDDLATGACSVLEHGYLTKVERAHGLPKAARQVLRVTPAGNEYRDIDYEDFGLVVELDGALGHDSWKAQGRDADRDLDDLALATKRTARLRWKQVYGTPCRTAARIAAVLQQGGWTGSPRPCGPDCPVGVAER